MPSSADLLHQELSLWQQTGHKLHLWWRDDDAVQETDALHKLLKIQQQTTIPLSLAVVPGQLQASLAPLLNEHDGSLTVLQHGFTHHNNALPTQKKIELGGTLRPKTCVKNLITGMKMLKKHFPDLFLPILVPPWNRLDDALIPAIEVVSSPDHFMALSLFGFNKKPTRMQLINTHIDIIDWSTRQFIGYDTMLDYLRQAAQYLRQHKQWHVPIGLLTHHLVHDNACWKGLELFLKERRFFKNTHWLSIKQILVLPL